MKISMFYITVGSKEEAERLAKAIIEKRLAACVNLLPAIQSFFFWENEAQSEEETLLLGKTSTSLVEDLVAFVKEEHSYDLPCIVTWPVGDGYPPFLQWVNREVEEGKGERESLE